MQRLPWILAALVLALLAAGAAIAGVDWGNDLFTSALALVFSAVGALVASRQPDNATGWIFLGVGISTGLGGLAGSYADHWVADGAPQALGEAAAVYSSLGWMPFILVPCTFVLLLFPDGHLVSPRWRWVAWCAGAGIAGVFLTSAVHPGPLDDFPDLPNPYAIDSPLIDPLMGLSVLLLLAGMLGSAASLIVRYRRSEGERRQQIKWLALAGAVAAVVVPIAAAGSDVLWGDAVTNIASMLGVLCLPVAAGIAILRYRLYDIDVVINRTLVYGALSAALAAAYLLCVLLLQLALSPLTPDSGLAIAASTLAVAAMFRPARARVQGLVDRRFYRRRYDAAQTLEAFGERLREELDLEALGSDLRDVVAEAMQPAHVSLWLRGR